MKELFIADAHLGHGSIIEYENRPYKSASHAIDQFIKRANQQVNDDDIVYHVGDFACYGRAKGIEGLRIHAKDIIAQLNGTWIFIEGNHDANNKVKCCAKFLMMGIANRPAILSHFPSTDFYDKIWSVHRFIDKSKISLWICGHVHGKWKYSYDQQNNILNINVGMDVWNHNLVKKTKLIAYIDKIKRELKDPFFPKQGK